jgi:hypothetical protein
MKKTVNGDASPHFAIERCVAQEAIQNAHYLDDGWMDAHRIGEAAAAASLPL